MHDHDLDLIAEYATGELAGGDAARAAELVTTCDRCAAEFSTQQSIRTLLASAPRPAMSELERTRLHRRVVTELAPVTGGGTPWWQRRFPAIAAVAAALFVVVGGIGVVGRIGGDNGGIVTAADGETAGTTAPSALIAPGTRESADETADALAADSGGAPPEDPLEEAAEMAQGFPAIVNAGPIDRATLDAILEEVRTVVRETDADTDPIDIADAGFVCADSVSEEILGAVVAAIDGRTIEVYLTGRRADPTETALLPPQCTPTVP